MAASPFYGETVRELGKNVDAVYDRCTNQLAEQLDCDAQNLRPLVYLFISAVLDYAVWDERENRKCSWCSFIPHCQNAWRRKRFYIRNIFSNIFITTQQEAESNMKFKWMAKLAAVAFAAFLAVSAVSVFADGEKQLTVHFEDVTAADATTQYGEAKIKVSLSGVSGKASVIQNAFTFDGLEYKSVRFLKGENDPPKGFWYAPTDLAAVNADKKFTLGIASVRESILRTTKKFSS